MAGEIRLFPRNKDETKKGQMCRINIRILPVNNAVFKRTKHNVYLILSYYSLRYFVWVVKDSIHRGFVNFIRLLHVYFMFGFSSQEHRNSPV